MCIFAANSKEKSQNNEEAFPDIMPRRHSH